jgi:hypothetical protein
MDDKAGEHVPVQIVLTCFACGKNHAKIIASGCNEITLGITE